MLQPIPRNWHAPKSECGSLNWNIGMRTDSWKQKAAQLKREIRALCLAMNDPRTPWYARILSEIIVGYAFSPIPFDLPCRVRVYLPLGAAAHGFAARDG
jgi:hypothetical protein